MAPVQSARRNYKYTGGGLTCGASHLPSLISRHVIFCLVDEPGRRSVKFHNRHPHRIPDARMISTCGGGYAGAECTSQQQIPASAAHSSRQDIKQ